MEREGSIFKNLGKNQTQSGDYIIDWHNFDMLHYTEILGITAHKMYQCENCDYKHVTANKTWKRLTVSLTHNSVDNNDSAAQHCFSLEKTFNKLLGSQEIQFTI